MQHTVQRCLVYSAACVEGSAGDKTIIRGEMSKCRVCYLLSVWLQAVEERRMWPVCLPKLQGSRYRFKFDGTQASSLANKSN